MKADYSAQELRILAHVTGDENLLEAFRAQAKGGKDPHLVVGEKIAGRELEKGTEEGDAFRAAGKRANYGFSYGAGWKRYQRSIYEDTAELIPDKQAMSERWAFQEAWPEVTKWQQTFGDREGHEPEAWYTVSFLGRRRYVSRERKAVLPTTIGSTVPSRLAEPTSYIWPWASSSTTSFRTPTSSSPPTTRWFWSAR